MCVFLQDDWENLILSRYHKYAHKSLKYHMSAVSSLEGDWGQKKKEICNIINIKVAIMTVAGQRLCNKSVCVELQSKDVNLWDRWVGDSKLTLAVNVSVNCLNVTLRWAGDWTLHKYFLKKNPFPSLFTKNSQKCREISADERNVCLKVVKALCNRPNWRSYQYFNVWMLCVSYLRLGPKHQQQVHALITGQFGALTRHVGQLLPTLDGLVLTEQIHHHGVIQPTHSTLVKGPVEQSHAEPHDWSHASSGEDADQHSEAAEAPSTGTKFHGIEAAACVEPPEPGAEEQTQNQQNCSWAQ